MDAVVTTSEKAQPPLLEIPAATTNNEGNPHSDPPTITEPAIRISPTHQNSSTSPKPKASLDLPEIKPKAKRKTEFFRQLPIPGVGNRRPSVSAHRKSTISVSCEPSHHTRCPLGPPLETVSLPRGGTYVKTKFGPIQIGIPPETIKDSMNLGLDVPRYFLVPPRRFDLKMGLNVAEFEFPSYFNFFVRRKQVNFICTKAAEAAIRIIAQETLLGPKQIDPDIDYSPKVPMDQRADLRKELDFFARNPFNPSEVMTVDTLMRFHTFEADGSITINEDNPKYQPGGEEGGEPEKLSIVIREEKGLEFVFIEEGLEVARVSNAVLLPTKVTTTLDTHETKEVFVPPNFGVTVLGNSHGFDPSQSTSGYVVWINGRGVMVDPPPNSGHMLAEQGIAGRYVDTIILSHAHADHDAGTFQKILAEKKINVLTTRTIFDSFMRKYAGVTGMDETFLRTMVNFRPAIIGAPMRVHCGEFYFFYSLHSIPCIGFELHYGNKSMFFSGDTCIDPPRIEKMCADGIMRQGRSDFFTKNYPWHHSIVLHEAGVPPLHTPMAALIALPDAVKANLYAVHVADKDMPPADSGIKHARVGVQHTIRCDDVVPPDCSQTVKLLDLIQDIEMFNDLNVLQARYLAQCCRLQTYAAGTPIVQEGTPGGEFFLIAAGVATVSFAGKIIKKQYRFGDYFGEASIMTGHVRSASIVAVTEVEVWMLDRIDFLYLFENTQVAKRLQHLIAVRQQRSSEVLNLNSRTVTMTESQKTAMQSILEAHVYKAGEAIWERGKNAEFGFIVDKGSVKFARKLYSAGNFFADLAGMSADAGPAYTCAIYAETDVEVFRCEREELLNFFDENPGYGLSYYDSVVIPPITPKVPAP